MDNMDRNMTRKILVIVLAVVAVTLLADVAYIGSILFAKEEPPTREVVTDGSGMVGLYNPYEGLATQPTQSDVLASPYNPQTSQPATVPQLPNTPMDTTDATDADGNIIPTDVQPENEQPIQLQSGTYTLEQTVTEMQNAVAYLKNAKNFTGYKKIVPYVNDNIDISIDLIEPAARTIINKFADSAEYTYVYSNGVADDPKTTEVDYVITPSNAIPPTDRDFRIDMNGLTGYSAVKNSDGSVTFTVGIREESCDVTQAPVYHAACMDYLDMNEYDISPAKIHYGTVTYHESVVSVTIDANGIPIALHLYMPLTGTGEGSLMGFTAQATLSGSVDETWTFVW